MIEKYIEKNKYGQIKCCACDNIVQDPENTKIGLCIICRVLEKPKMTDEDWQNLLDYGRS